MRKEKRIDFQNIEAKAGANGRILSKSQKEIYDALRVDTWEKDIGKISVVDKLEEALSQKEIRAFSLYAEYDSQEMVAKEMGIRRSTVATLLERAYKKIKELGKDNFF